MIVRKIKPEELKRGSQLFAVAFEQKVDNHLDPQAFYEEAVKDPVPRNSRYALECWAAFEDDDKTMMSQVMVTPFTVNFDGNRCGMVGIGGVSTFPQYRRAGGVRGCFEKALPAMYAEDVAFSYLYPFSTAYYRKFGYELGCERISYQIKLSYMVHYPVKGNCRLVEQSNPMLDDIRKIHTVWQNQYNMMVENEASEYAWAQKANPSMDQEYSYVYFSAQGAPKAYVSFRLESGNGQRNLRCNRMVFVDVEGFQGVMNLLQSCASEHDYLFFDLPADQHVTPFFPEWAQNAGECKRSYRGMVRVVNVEKVLKMANYQGSGSVTMQISDPYIPQNNGIFTVCFQDGKAVEVRQSTEQLDISMGINDFSRLILGIYGAEAFPFLQTVCVHRQIEDLKKIFYCKPCFLTEFF